MEWASIELNPGGAKYATEANGSSDKDMINDSSQQTGPEKVLMNNEPCLFHPKIIRRVSDCGAVIGA